MSHAQTSELANAQAARVAAEAAVTEAARLLSSVSTEVLDISADFEQLAADAEAQNRSFHRIARAAAEVAAANDQIAANAVGSNDHLRGAIETISASEAEIRTTVAELSELSGTAGRTLASLERLQSSLASVSDISGTISGIASQTNMLSLNARIEAARAGEAGKGFSVVAEAVRTLAEETSQATRSIDDLVGQLNEAATEQEAGTRDTVVRADAGSQAATKLATSVESVSDALNLSRDASEAISTGGDEIRSRSAEVSATLESLTENIDRNSNVIAVVRDRCGRLVGMCEDAMRSIARHPENAFDRPMIDKVQNAAKRLSALLEAELSAGRCTIGDLFDRNYRPIPGTNPQQVSSSCLAATDRVMPKVQEEIVGSDKRIVFCAACDVNGYIPTHNLKFSQPQGEDPVWNAANARNRRIFDDRVGLAAGKNTEPYLLQVYRRDMGGGSWRLMKDVSAPIIVGGKHWGGLRLAYV